VLILVGNVLVERFGITADGKEKQKQKSRTKLAKRRKRRNEGRSERRKEGNGLFDQAIELRFEIDLVFVEIGVEICCAKNFGDFR
jgi:hypothetical protein